MAISLPSRLFTNPWLAVIPFLLVFSYALIGSLDFPLHDFGNSYFAAYLFLHGPWDLSLFDPGKFNQAVYDAGFHSQFLSFNPNPPSSALIFAPLAYFPPFVAKGIWNIFGILCFTLSIYRLATYLKLSNSQLVWIPFVFFVPIRNNILYGQSYFILFSLVAEGYLFFETDKKFLGMVLWSVAIFLKLFPLVLIIFLIMKKEWKSVVYLGFCCLLILSICLYFQGINIWEYYVGTVLPRSFNGEISTPFVLSHQSFQTFFQFAFIQDSFLNPSPWVNIPSLYPRCLLIVKLILVSFTLLIVWKKPTFMGFGFLFLFVLLVLSYGSTYGLLVLLFLCLHVIQQRLWIVLLGIFLLCNVSHSYFHSFPLLFQFPRLFFLMAIFLFVVFDSVPKKFLISAPLLILLLIFIPIKKSASSIPEKEWISTNQHPIILDMYIQENKLYYDYWGQNGRKTVQVLGSFEELRSDKVKIWNNQVFSKNIQLTTSEGQKKNPVVLKDKIIFLSDYGKGPGFYSIWYIPLGKN